MSSNGAGPAQVPSPSPSPAPVPAGTPATTSTASEAAPSELFALQPDHVNLRVTYLVTGNPRPPHSLGNVHLNTTVAALKDRIHDDLPEHPAPAEQRLIYQGRPLLRNEVTVRDVLRLEPGTGPGPLPYTLHIIIHPHGPSSHGQSSHGPVTQGPSTNAAQPSPSPHLSGHLTPFDPLHHAAGPPDPLRSVDESALRLQESTRRLHESIARIHHQIESNRWDLRQVQDRLAAQHHGMANLGQTPAPAQRQGQGQGQGQDPGDANEAHRPFGGPAHQGRIELTTPPMFAAPLFTHPADPGDRPVAGTWTPPPPGILPQRNVQSFTGPNGERMTIMTDVIDVPLERSSSAPGRTGTGGHATGPMLPPRTHLPPASQIPLQLPAQPILPHRTTHSPPPPQAPPALPSAPGLAAPAHFPLPEPPAMLPLPSHPLRRVVQNRQGLPPSQATTAWLLSSPSGPQALVFAPGFGYFSNMVPATTQAAPVEATAPASATAATPVPAPQPTSSQHRGAGLPTPPAQPAPPGVPVQNGAPPPAARPAPLQVADNDEDNDVFALLIQRGWLFLRLYLFMFVFSEPGTWKRWVMIVIAVVVCLQPRNGPLVRWYNALRHHLDHLMGPPAPPPRLPPRPDPVHAANGVAERPRHVRGAVQMTPEDAAARLVREHQERHANVWRNLFYRFEQSTALFLASLIPGVGERHVRAREEARREAQRLEQERQRVAEEAATAARAVPSAPTAPNPDGAPLGEQDIQGPSPEVKTDAPAGTASTSTSSTAVEVQDATLSEPARELRHRST